MTRVPWFSWLREVAGPLLGLVFIFALFVWHENVRAYFFDFSNPGLLDNYRFLLVQTTIVAMAAIGMTLVIVSGGIDLSVGSVVALSGVSGAVLVAASSGPEGVPGWAVPLAIVVAVMVGGFCGLINGLLVALGGISPFIVTLGTMGIARGAAKGLAGNQNVYVPDTWVNQIMFAIPDPEWLILPPGVWFLLLMAGGMMVVMHRTVFGRYVTALGSNENTARLCGLPVRSLRCLTYVVAGFFFGCAGVLQWSRQTIGNPTASVGLELEVIAAVVIGGASLSGGTGTLLGALLGALLMSVLRTCGDQMGLPSWNQEILVGIVIILAIGIDRLRQIRRSS